MKNIKAFTKVAAITLTAAFAVAYLPVIMDKTNCKAPAFRSTVFASELDDRTQKDFENYYDYSSAFLSLHGSELDDDVRICLETARNNAYTALQNDSGSFEAMSNLRVQLSVAEAIYDGRQPDSNSAPLPVIGTAGYNEAFGINSKAAGTVASIYSTNRNLPPEMIRTLVLNNFVERMYSQIFGRTCSIQERDSWVNALASGSIKPAGVVTGMLATPEFTNRNFSNEQFVTMLYNAAFDRDPDTAGMTNWVNALNNGTSRDSVVQSFLTSDGFTKLCAVYGL